MNAATAYHDLIDWALSHVTAVDMFLVQSAVTCCALFWLLHRAWLTLWKPVSQLISILGVEVPDAPEVSLAGIKADAVTLHWTRPEANRPVMRYLIQVNGVNVGESSRLETAITVTGLKAGHFYNVRVIAVGPNDYQAGSSVIRLRTYGRDGRPQLENGRVPANLLIDEPPNGVLAESSDEAPAVRSLGAGVEVTVAPEGTYGMAREQSGGHPGQRRNTGGRKHSPSTAAEQAALARSIPKVPEESMQELTEKFEAIRKETDDVVGQLTRDAEVFEVQMQDFTREKDEKRQALKEKEEASEKLKKEVHYSERANRQAQNRKTQKEKVLREKQAEAVKMQDDIARWKKEMDDMREEQGSWKNELEELQKNKAAQTIELRKIIRKRQNSLNGLEEEIRIKGLQIKELEEARKSLPGGEDNEESKEREVMEKQRDLEWDTREKDLTGQLNSQTIHLRQLQADYERTQVNYAALAARQAISPLMYQQANSSGVDFDPAGGQKAKPRRSRNRKSRTSTISSPIAGFSSMDSTFPSAASYSNLGNTTSPSFAAGPYFDLRNDTAMVPLSEMSGMSEADVRALTAGAPLSPTATQLLPSNIFQDDDPPSPHGGSMHFGPALPGSLNYENENQSPGSSSRSASLMSSPQASSQNLALYGVSGHDYGAESERRSLKSPRANFGVIGSPNTNPINPAKPPKTFGNLFTFPRARGKNMPDDGPSLGSLKQGQSQSFPRSTEEPEGISSRSRRISFSSGWSVPSIFNRNSTGSDAIEGNAPAPARNLTARRRRAFDMFGSSIDDPSLSFDRDPSSPRPLSIASSDLPRPSTDSAPFGWPAAEGINLNRNSPLATNWSLHAPQQQPWSTNPSRRPSIQHASTTALTSGIASEDDEFLPPETLAGQSSPPPVGVIGSRPLSSHKTVTPKLNPAAPTFKAMFSRAPKTDKVKNKPQTLERTTTADEPSSISSSNALSSSPSDSRKSRDSPSIHTQNSISESHDSLERTLSNTNSDANASASGREKNESSLQKLLRKGSSSKFRAGFFGGKKGGAAASSERMERERDGSFDGLGDDGSEGLRRGDSVTSSPMIGSLPGGSGSGSGLGWGEGKGKDRREGETGSGTGSQVGTPKEGRMSVNWGRLKSFKKKGKEVAERESLDFDRDGARSERSEAEMTGTEDEG